MTYLETETEMYDGTVFSIVHSIDPVTGMLATVYLIDGRVASHEAWTTQRDNAAYDEHMHDMAWMFTPEYGYHTQADLDACPDYRHSLKVLHSLAQRRAR